MKNRSLLFQIPEKDLAHTFSCHTKSKRTFSLGLEKKLSSFISLLEVSSLNQFLQREPWV